MNTRKIADFNVNDRIEGFYIIKEIDVKTASNGNLYLDMKLGDNTGDINAKLWDCKEENIKSYSINSIVKIRGEVNEWQGKKQLRIILMRPAIETDNVKLEELVQAAPYDSQQMYNQIQNYIKKIANQDISRIVTEILEDYKDKLLFYPAAKQNHHSIRSGLLYHIMRMLMVAEKLTEVYTNVNRDLLYAGVILHDIAKIDEMEANELGVVSEYTIEGQLLGHIVQGVKIIDDFSRRLGVNREVSILLQHMILSHHYEPEFGSPKKPMIPEAELLHYIDIIDARMYDMESALSNAKPNEFTDKIWVLDNRKLYKSALDNPENELDEDNLSRNFKKLYKLDKDDIYDQDVLSKFER